MSFEAAITHELPLLRRYARSLTGSRRVGDAAVRETLQALIAAPEEFSQDVSVRLELYRVFHKLWTDTSLRPIDMPGAVVGSLPRKLRKPLLLSTIETFTPDEVAYILDLSTAEVTQQIAAAREDIHAMLASRVMIIEDEGIIALHLKSLMSSMGHEVCAVVRTASEAISAASEHQPELILADVNLADGSSGIDAVGHILTEMTVPVIFITAFPEKLLTGEGQEPAYVIAKPYNPDAVVATAWQALLVSQESQSVAENA